MAEPAIVAPDAPVATHDHGGPGDRARLVVLDRARAVLLVRLHRRPDDLAATVELQSVNAESAELTSHADSHESDQLARGGLSGNDLIRWWVRSKLGRRSDR